MQSDIAHFDFDHDRARSEFSRTNAVHPRARATVYTFDGEEPHDAHTDSRRKDCEDRQRSLKVARSGLRVATARSRILLMRSAVRVKRWRDAVGKPARSVTIEVMTGDESIVGTGRFAIDRDGHAAMRRYVQAWPENVWAVDGLDRR